MSNKDDALKLALAFIEDTAKYLPHVYDAPGLAVNTAIREALAEQPASNVNAAGGPKAFFSLAERPAQQKPKFSARDDAERLKSVGRGMSYNDASEAVWKHTLMEIAMRLETGGYTSPQPAQQQDHDCALKRGGIVCRHCDLEIVEVSHDPQIARQQDIPDLIAGALGVSRGTAYDMMREALVGAQQQSAERGEPVKACVTGQCPCKSECDSAQCCLYTSPPASKPWVPLTDEEREELWYRFGYMELMRAIEDKLREKNA